MVAEVSSGGPIYKNYCIGDYTIQLRFPNQEIIPYQVPPFEHLITETEQDPDLVIYIWDSGTTGVPMPPAPWSSSDYMARGEVRGYNDSRFNTAVHGGSDVLSILDKKSNQAIWWARDVRHLPTWEYGSPMVYILSWWMSRHNRQFIHAGAVGKSNCGILLAGKGGSGKSMTALLCLNSDLLYASDDYCLVNTAGSPVIYSIYSSAKIHEKDIHKLSHISDKNVIQNIMDNEKLLLFLHQSFNDKIVKNFPLKYIFIPRICNAVDTSITKATPMDALKALAPSTIFQLSRSGQKTFQNITNIAKAVPGYFLNLGSDISQISASISDFIENKQECVS